MLFGPNLKYVQSFIAWFSLMYEFPQLSSFSFKKTVEWDVTTRNIADKVYASVSLDYVNGNAFIVQFWFIVAVYIIHSILYQISHRHSNKRVNNQNRQNKF